MKGFWKNFRGMFGGAKPLLTPEEFTDKYVETLREAASELKVEILKDLELKITMPNGKDSTALLYNAYEIYQRAPKELEEIISRYIVSSMDTFGGMDNEVDRQRIVPIIKDRAWLEETQKAMRDRGSEKPFEQVFEDFSPDLVIVYAEDLPRNIRYLTPGNLKELNLDLKELRALACENLRQIIPSIECKGAEGLYMITAGGDYEASLLAVDKIWASGQFEVKGDIVVAVPTRDLLLVTGSENAEGIKKLRTIAEDAHQNGSYRLTPKLFVYRNGKFEWFGPDAALN
ncbi:MAG TPA: DUF1444 family protein [Verrucomicrobiae bacterium]